MGTTKINFKYLCNCQRCSRAKGCFQVPLLLSQQMVSRLRKEGSGVLWSLPCAHRIWIQNILPTIPFEIQRTAYFKKELFPVAQCLGGCLLQVCVLYFKAKASLVAMKVMFKNNHLSTKGLRRKFSLSYPSPCKSGLRSKLHSASHCYPYQTMQTILMSLSMRPYCQIC